MPSVGANGRRGQGIQSWCQVDFKKMEMENKKRFLAARTRNQAALRIEFGGEP